MTAIRITRYKEGTEEIYLNPALTEEQHQHPSETSLDMYFGFDYAVTNDSMEELRESAAAVLEDMGLIEKEMPNVSKT